MNFEYLNKMIQYIEENLTEEIDYKKLAQIVGVSEYSLQRIFIFLTNISISEYIRKRRLSRAFEELKTSDIKIIDLAIKYQYDSSISFSRAFKNMFGITPNECKKSNQNYKLFPIIKFDNNISCKELDYEVKEIDEKIVYGLKVSAKRHDDLLFKIRELYNEIENNGLYKKFDEIGMYGISLQNNNEQIYYVGCERKYEGTEKVVIPKGKYAIFNVGSQIQSDIVKTEDIIYKQWLESTGYKIDDDFNFELYVENNCYIYILIKDKQN